MRAIDDVGFSHKFILRNSLILTLEGDVSLKVNIT